MTKEDNLKLKGEKVFLRYPKAADSGEFIRMNKSSRRLHHGLVSPPVDKESYTSFINQNDYESNENLLICRNSDSAIIGVINLSQIFRKSFQNAYLGYYIGQEFAGEGYMTEAVKLILRYAFKDLKLHRIEANIQPQNKASLAVVKKNGFTKEGFSPKYLKISGRWRDHERWALIKENWK